MNVHSDYPYWMIRTGLIRSYPVLQNTISCDVLIIGGGITSALVSEHLVAKGLDVVVAEKGHIGHGSTSASTAILQYEIDEPLFRLEKQVGKETARRSYDLCCEAIDRIGDLAKLADDRADFEYHPSLYFATKEKHVKEIIQPEYQARKKQGIAVELLDRKTVLDKYGFESPGAILSAKAAHLNPYKLCHFLFNRITERGAGVYSMTAIKSWKKKARHFEALTGDGVEIKSKYIVVACGYESQSYLDKKVTDFDSTYAIASMPLAGEIPWADKAILWNTASPYLYLRTTSDNRIIVGGRDSEFQSAKKRDLALSRKKRQLENDFNNLFPGIRFQTDFAWAGTFAKTKDSLPYIGEYRERGVFYAMGYGGNGITFSQIAADIIGDTILKKKNADIDLFSFNR